MMVNPLSFQLYLIGNEIRIRYVCRGPEHVVIYCVPHIMITTSLLCTAHAHFGF